MIIRNEEDYQRFLSRIEEIWNCEKGSKEEIELDCLAGLVELYEKINFPIEPPTKEAAEEFRRDQERVNTNISATEGCYVSGSKMTGSINVRLIPVKPEFNFGGTNK